jgi:hypothetical protein
MAGAATQTHVASVALTSTDWTVTLQVPKFDPAIGDLQAISFELGDSLNAMFRVENLAPSSNTVRDSSKATITLSRPDETGLVQAFTAFEYTNTFPAFDGTIDFGGASGATAPDQLAYASASAATTAPADLALFTGTGTIGLPCKAVGRSYTSDTAGNVIHGVSTKAAAQVTVVYTYEVAVPATPATWGSVKVIYR